jgi:hypothetical protein
MHTTVGQKISASQPGYPDEKFSIRSLLVEIKLSIVEMRKSVFDNLP